MPSFFSKYRELFICILFGFLTFFICVASFYVLLDCSSGWATPVENSPLPIDYERLVQAVRASMVHNDQNILRQGEEFLGRSLSSEEAERLLSAKSESDPNPGRERRMRLVGQVVYMILCGLIAKSVLIGWGPNSDGVVIRVDSFGVPY